MEIDDLVICTGEGYPHWENHVFIVEVVFNDNTIGLNNKIRVNQGAFKIHGVGGKMERQYIIEEIKSKGFYFYEDFEETLEWEEDDMEDLDNEDVNEIYNDKADKAWREFLKK